jgi:hypothetical protein
MARSRLDSAEHHPEALAAAAAQALRDHGAEADKRAPIVADRMRELAAWAWQGLGSTQGLRDLILETAVALFRSPAHAFYGRSILADPSAPTWLEDLAAATGTDTTLGATLVAAAIRLDLMAGVAILPSTLAVLFRIDTGRIRLLIQKGELEDASASHPSAGRSGHRPKGADARVTAASAFRWMQQHGRVPADAKPPATRPTHTPTAPTGSSSTT